MTDTLERPAPEVAPPRRKRRSWDPIAIGLRLWGIVVYAFLFLPIVVIVVIAAATQSVDGSKGIVFPVVNEDQGPVATALIRAFREHLDVREVTRTKAHHLVAESNDAAAALILPPELSKRYLAQKPSNVELLIDPAQWQELEAIKIVMLLADRETASLGDPFSQELLSVKERNIGVTIEWRPARQALVQNRRQGIDIDRRCADRTAKPFGRHVIQGADPSPGCCQPRITLGLGDSEVD